MGSKPLDWPRWMVPLKSKGFRRSVTALTAVIAGLSAGVPLAAQGSARVPANPRARVVALSTVTLSNGTGDGNLSVQVDPYGAYGTFNTTGRSGLRYDPVGPVGVRETTFEAALWFSGAVDAGQGGQGHFLSSTSLYGGPGLPDAPFVSSNSSEARSSFVVDGIQFNLVQVVLPAGPAGSTLCQTYTLSNTRSVTADFDLIRYVDADLIFDGANNDRAAISEGWQRLYLFDNFADVSSPTYRMAIDMAGSANLGYQIAEFHTGDNLFQEGRAVLTNTITHDSVPGATENDANADLDGDRLTDSSFDINLLQGGTYTLPPGGSATLVVNTHLGMGSPENAIKPKIEWVEAPISVAAGTTASSSVQVTRDALGPIANATVLFKVSGSTGNSESASAVAGLDGQTPFAFRPLFPGAYTITATYDQNGNGARDPGEPSTTASSTALLPATTNGQGKGQGKVPAEGLIGKFKFSAKGNKLRGQGQVRLSIAAPPRSGGKPFLVQSTKVQSVVFRQTDEGWTTEVLGIARIKKGASLPFRIDALDHGKASALPDRFLLTLLHDVDGDGLLDAVEYGGVLLANAAGGRGNVVVNPPATPRAR